MTSTSLIEHCENIFNTDDLYTVLGVTKDASQQDVKKAYYRRSLAWHPDRATDDKDKATEKFQLLGQVYNVLSDPERRKVYDDTGSVDEDWVVQDKNWNEYWRLLFPKVTLKDIQEFEQKYKGSEEEKEDLKTAYLESEGDMEHILDTVLCSCYDDEERFREMITAMIKEGEVPDFDKFSKESKKKKAARKKKAKSEAAEAEEMAKVLKLNGEHNSLAAAIQKRQADRGRQADDFFSQLEAKYGGKSAGKKSKSKR